MPTDDHPPVLPFLFTFIEVNPEFSEHVEALYNSNLKLFNKINSFAAIDVMNKNKIAAFLYDLDEGPTTEELINGLKELVEEMSGKRKVGKSYQSLINY